MAIEKRLAQCKLELHPEKTRVVYCKDDDRRGNYPNEKFDFLGYTFRTRTAKNRLRNLYVNFSPAVSNESVRLMRQTMRRWRIHRRSDKSLDDFSRMFNPILRGWINYYGAYYRSGLYPPFQHLNRRLMRWAMQKYKRFRDHPRRAMRWLGAVARRDRRLFAHWEMGILPVTGR